MQGSMNLLSDRACRMTDVYSPEIDITEHLLGDSPPVEIAKSSIRSE
jgi:hypothetical protein